MSGKGLPLTLALCGEIEPRLQALRAACGEQVLSDYAFSNLYLFRHAHDYRYFPGALPRITGVTYDGASHVLPLFDPGQATGEQLAEALNGNDCLFPVAEPLLAHLDASRFCWSDLPADADYFYPAENFRSYRGELLRKKRNLMQQLLATNTIVARPLAEDTVADALAVLDAWLYDKDKRAGDADDSACREALQLHRLYGMEGQVYYAGGLPAGFFLAQHLAPSVAVMRFAKGSDTYKGIYQYMFHHYCIGKPGLQWLNFEQDLGMANFRQTKRSYQPSAMLRKYRVQLLT
jgi:uncharacterized protein